MQRDLVENYTITHELGSGTYGKVYAATRNDDPSVRVAIKILRFESADEGIPATLLREISALKDLRHENVVNLLEVLLPNPMQVNLVFEYCELDLKSFMTKKAEEFRTVPDLTRVLMFQLCRGMAYIHHRRYLHRDLKPQNLLINTEEIPRMKIADFGLSRSTAIPVRKFVEKVVTLWYRAPELLLGETKYTSAVDVWSVGCIFAEMAQAGKPFLPCPRNGNEQQELSAIFEKFGTPAPQEWPEAFALKNKNWLPSETTPPRPGRTIAELVPELDEDGRDLLARMMAWNPAHRITCAAALQHPYFSRLPPNIRVFDPVQ